MKKTNVMRLLDQQKIEYTPHFYDIEDGKIDGVSVANKLKMDPDTVFKTLVTEADNQAFVFIIPVEDQLDLKKAARACGVKKLDMLAQKKLKGLTGYVHGGCSPIGMKKDLPTYIDQSAQAWPAIGVSAGKLGAQVVLDPEVLAKITQAEFVDLTMDQE